jgi:O-antigen/teichoic acid export membrane protein
MDNRTVIKRLTAGSVLRVTSLFCNVGVSFYMIPFLIHSLGDRWYGFWVLVGTLIGYYGFLDLGLSSAAARFTSRALGNRDHDAMNSVINNSLFLFTLMGITAFIISVGAALLSPHLIRHSEEAVVFKKLILIVGLSTAFGFPMRALVGVLSAQFRYDLITYVELFKLGLRTFLIIYFIRSGYGILSLAFTTLCVDLAGHAINFVLVKHEFKQLKLRMAFPKKKNLRELFDYSKFTLLSQLADTLRFQCDTLVIATYLNVDTITRYSVGQKPVHYFGQFIQSAVGIFSPVFSQQEARNDYEGIRRWFLGATKLSAFLSVFAGGSLIYYGDDFLARWMGAEYRTSYYILVILCVPAIFALIQNPSIGLLYGISKHKYYAYANICEGVLNLVLSLILVRSYGMYGVALGTMIEMLIFKLAVQPIYSCRVIQLPLHEYYLKALFTTCAKTAVPLALFFYCARSLLRPDYSTILALGLSQCVLFVPVVIFFILNREERRQLRSMYFRPSGDRGSCANRNSTFR